MEAEDLSRKVVIDVAKSGHVMVRIGKRRTGWLPVFSTDTEDEALQIIRYHCRMQYDGSYRLNEGELPDLEALYDVGEKFRATYYQIIRH